MSDNNTIGIPETLKYNFKAIHEETLRIEAKISSETLTVDKMLQLLDRQQKLQSTMIWISSIGKKFQENTKIIQPKNGTLLSVQ